MSDSITERSLTEQLRDLEAGQYSSRELTEAYLQKIASASDINAYITVS
ncbi:MAG: hypothetical protein JJ956_14635, partial [Pseudomonadales bacterium]|nr:hypothetical protein [Pseudomonadales bacterium]